MADTVITNTPGSTRSTDDSSAVAWLIGLIIVVALLVAGFFVFRNSTTPLPATGGSTIQVNVPNPTDSGGAGGTTGGPGSQ